MAADPTRPLPALTVLKLVGVLLAVGVLAAGVLLPYIGGLGLAAGKLAGKFLDTTCHYHDSPPPQPTTIYARDGKTKVARLFTQNRVQIPLSQIPQSLQDALIATEDRHFYEHHGVDFGALVRSAINTGSGDTQGGSTLTMQYVKQVRYYQAGDNKKKQEAAIAVNLNRKLEDAKCALYIEGTLHKSKQQILNDYLNIAFFGEHAYGIQTAAETYFNKPARDLTLAESAMLVGLLRAPSAYDPFINPAAARQRRNEVLQNLVAVGKLSQSAADRVEATPIALATQAPPLVQQGCANANSTIPNAPFFCDYLVNWLENVEKISPTELQTGGLKIISTLDPKVQARTQHRMTAFVPAKSAMTAVLPVIDPHSGDVLAMAASKTYGSGPGQTEQPIFTRETAQGASTFKLFPLLVALSTGVPDGWQLKTVGSTGSWKPKHCATSQPIVNGDSNISYQPLETLSQAIADSSNTYFVKLADELLDCNLQPIIDLATRLGIHSLDDQETHDLTVGQAIAEQQRAQQLVLGSVPVSPLEIAGAYAAVANGGRYNAPAPVLSIQDRQGNGMPIKRTPGVPVIAPQVAAQAATMLTGDTSSAGTSASVFSDWNASHPTLKVAGKTGTAESNRKGKNSAIWFVGMTPNLVGAAGIVDFDNTSAPSSGLVGQAPGAAYGDFAAKVWLHAMSPTLARQSWTWPFPELIGFKAVPDVTGLSLADARRTLRADHFKMTELGASDQLQLQCPSNEPYNTVAYYGPKRADPGATITVCLSSQTPQYRPPPPPPPPPPVITHPTHHHHHHHGGDQGGGGQGGPRPGPGPGPGPVPVPGPSPGPGGHRGHGPGPG